MFEKKAFWYFLMFGAIALWVVVIGAGFLLFPDSAAGKALLPALSAPARGRDPCVVKDR
jgi:hypothetical protein